MTRSYLAVLAILSGTTKGDFSSSKQCYGPDYSERYPFYGIPNDLCCHAYYNTSNTKELSITLSYGSTVFGEDTISDVDPDADEHAICDPHFPSPEAEALHACRLCLEFDDIFMAESWARICPKYVLRCEDPFGGTHSQSISTPCFTVGDDDTDDVMQIVGGNTDFALKLLSSKAATEDIVQDLFISPFSITNALVMCMMAASGETLEQLMNAFELTTDDYALFDSFDTIVQSLQHDTRYTKNAVVNELWLNTMWDQVVDPVFLSDFDRFGDIESCDFRNHSHRETELIDAEIESLSHNLIQHPLNGESLSSSTVMLFTNTMYFRGTWLHLFYHNVTETFVDDDGDDVTITMMCTDHHPFPHYDDGEVEVIELPFNDEDSEISFVMLRPSVDKFINDGPTSTIAFEKTLDRKKLKKYLDGMTSAKDDILNITLPYLEMYNMEDITSSLQQLGIEDVFDPKKADMRNMTVPRYQVFETNLNRQDYLKIGRETVEIASLVTDGNGDGEPTNQGKVMHADRPFVFLVVDRSVDLILYAGRVTNPKGWMVRPLPAKKEEKGGRAGTVFLVLLLVGTTSYLIIKYIYNRSVVGMSGVDAVPHIGMIRGCVGCIEGKVKTLRGQGGMPVPGSQPRERYAPMMSDADNMAL